MKLVAPSFWFKRNLMARILRPLAWIYEAIADLRYARSHPQRVSVPVICVGNLSLGGSGKTPVALALVKQYLQDAHFLSRGYGGHLSGPLQVTSEQTAQEVGDEALLLARQATTWVSRNRFAGALKAIKNGATALVMDDGLQNYQLHQDIRFIVVDGFYGFGNEYVFPAGPLRENLIKGLKHADALIIVGQDNHNIEKRFASQLPIFHVTIELDRVQLVPIPQQPYIAFAGIGYPEKFHHFLLEQELNIIDFQAFPDHHPYQPHELKHLWQEAVAHHATLITTAKDYVRLPEHYRQHVQVCPIEARFIHPDKLGQFLKEKLEK